MPGIRGLGERGFSTALGNPHERIALAIASDVHAEVHRSFDLSGNLPVLAREFAHEVKLGDELWDFVGGAAGTYDVLLGLYREVGVEYTSRLDQLRQAFAARLV